MRPVSAGRVRVKAVTTVHNNATKAMARRVPLPVGGEKVRLKVISMPLCRHGASELHLRWRLHIVACGELCHRLIGAEKSSGPQQAGEGLELGVVESY